eukprot:m.61178 g.61178  ORF g.61178 m.61178 type:complete len:90 (+) comp17529_c0_seq1:299-568(+)
MPGRARASRGESRTERLIDSPAGSECLDLGADMLAIRADDEHALFPIRRLAGTPSACRKLCVTASILLLLLSIFVIAVTYLQHAFGDKS